MQIENPRTRDEIIQASEQVEAQVAAFFGGLPADEFALRGGDAWTPAEHLSHLNTSVSAVAKGLAVPRLLLRLRFGRARKPSRGYEEVREMYRAALAAGGVASGAFVPPRESGAGDDDVRRRELLARWGRANARLRSALAGWSEDDLDRLRMPHPLIGKLTVREMMFFTLYHNAHHVAAARRRIPRLASEDG